MPFPFHEFNVFYDEGFQLPPDFKLAEQTNIACSSAINAYLHVLFPVRATRRGGSRPTSQAAGAVAETVIT